MKKILLSIITIGVLSTSLFSGQNSDGAYIGLGYGVTGYSDDDYLNKELNLDNLDKSDSGFKVYGGYQFNNIVAVEGSYTDYGEFSADQSFKNKSKSFSVAANLGYSFLDGQLRPFGIIGLGYANTSFNNYPTSTYDNSTGTYTIITPPDKGHGTIHYGLGIQYEPDILQGAGIRLAYESDIYSMTFERTGSEDKTYTESLGIAYLGIQYKF